MLSTNKIDNNHFNTDFINKEIKGLSKKPLILFGAGNMSEFVLYTIRKMGLDPIYFCDNDIKKVGKYIDDVEIIGFEELCKIHKDSNIYITSTFYFNNIKEQLMANGFEETNISELDLVYMFPWEENYSQYIEKHEKDFQRLSLLLADELSKKVLLNRLEFLKSRDRKYMIDIRTNNQYFDEDLIKLNEDEIFIDLGAYDGDSIKSFINKSNNRYKKIYAVEPDERHYEKLYEYTKTLRNSDIEIIKAGIWNEDGNISYKTICGSFALTLAEDDLIFDDILDGETSTMKTVTVDSILKGEPATFIKMDVVGVEKEALEGAKNTIEKYQPILAVCVYHKASDIYSLPEYILEICPDYNIYLRHYSDGVSETVCYAIPKGRMK